MMEESGPNRDLRENARRYDIDTVRAAFPISQVGLLCVTLGVILYTDVISVDLIPVPRAVTALTVFLLGVIAIGVAVSRMRRNVGGSDWWSRVVLGGVLVVAGIAGFGDVALVIGSFLLIVGVAGIVGDRPGIGMVALVAGLVIAAEPIPIAFRPLPEAFVSLFVILYGALAINTAVTRRCPVNLVLGIDTCRHRVGVGTETTAEQR